MCKVSTHPVSMSVSTHVVSSDYSEWRRDVVVKEVMSGDRKPARKLIPREEGELSDEGTAESAEHPIPRLLGRTEKYEAFPEDLVGLKRKLEEHMKKHTEETEQLRTDQIDLSKRVEGCSAIAEQALNTATKLMEATSEGFGFYGEMLEDLQNVVKGMGGKPKHMLKDCTDQWETEKLQEKVRELRKRKREKQRLIEEWDNDEDDRKKNKDKSGKKEKKRKKEE